MLTEKTVIGQGGPYPLNGILALPEGEWAPVPAAVFVHGSGSTNMDEKIFANAPFRDMAEGLAARGIASVRYDKRTFVYGRKLVKDPGFSVKDETIDDALIAAELLKADPRIDAGRVYIIGHSMGGMLAPRIDEAGADFAGFVIMAGTPRTLEAVLFEQYELIAATAKGLNGMAAKKIVKSLRAKLAGLYEMDDGTAKTIKVMGGARVYYFKEMGVNDTPSYLAKTAKPMLIMQGGKDGQVSVERDFDVYRELLANRDNVAFRLYPELNHLFMPSVYSELKDLKKEYKIPGHVDEGVIDDIASWIHTGALA